MTNKFFMIAMSLFATFTLAACGVNDTTKGDTTENGTDATNNNDKMNKEVGENMDGNKYEDGQAIASTSGDIPEGLKEAENPKFAVGDKVIINAAHMEGMEGAEGTIVGAYETTAYSVSYTPTTGDDYQENHKWVVKEEITPVDDKDIEKLNQGAEVIINSDREEGMLGAKGEIDTSEDTIVYMVDFKETTGEEVKNYQWLKESELSAP